MFKQTEEKYKSIRMGFGEGSIYDYGCYLVSLVNGLNSIKNYNFTPEGFNDFLKDNDLWTEKYKNYIDVERLSLILPSIFTSYVSKEPWSDITYLKMQLDAGAVVLGKVSAKGIGGTGSHFVLITSVDGENAIIHDPWTGEHQPVAKRYNKYGNILGLRIFGVKENAMGDLGNWKINPDDDIPTWFEDALNLKSYPWYNKHWTFEEWLKTTSKLSKYQETIRTLKEDKKRLRNDLIAKEKELNELFEEERKRLLKTASLEKETIELRKIVEDRKDYEAIKLEHESCKNSLSKYISQSTVADGISIMIKAILKRRWVK